MTCAYKENALNRNIGFHSQKKLSHSFWQVSFDIMGPLPDYQGNKYVLLIVN